MLKYELRRRQVTQKEGEEICLRNPGRQRNFARLSAVMNL